MPAPNTLPVTPTLPTRSSQELNRAIPNAFGYGNDVVGAPRIGNNTGNAIGGTNYIFNVHSDYCWTLNKSQTVRSYIPQITLTEYNLTQSGQLNSLKLQLMATAESTTALAAAATPATSILGKVFGTATQSYLNKKGVNKTVSSTLGFAVDAATTAGGAIGAAEVAQKLAGPMLGKSFLDPYYNLYPSTPTGLTYVLPYLNTDNMTGTAGTWKNADTSKTIQNLKDLGAGGVEEVVSAALGGGKVGNEAAGEALKTLGGIAKATQAIAQLQFALGSPGQGTEKIKVFTPNDDGDEINVVFYLFNTESIEDIQNNWNFLFTLTYQNLPNRRSINLLDPPCVYSVDVPGFKSFPIAAITKLQVTNEGTTRLIDITTGEMAPSSSSSANVKMIPEAYKVTMTFKSLLINTRNLFWNSFQNNNKINVFGGATNAP